MPMPQDKDARLFFRVAQQRLAEAEDILRLGYTTVAVYLGGYVVETMLKVLLIESSPKVRRRKMVKDFRGARGHDLEYLRGCYYDAGGARMPKEVAQRFFQANSWSTQLRYFPGRVEMRKANDFLAAVKVIFHWAEGRL